MYNFFQFAEFLFAQCFALRIDFAINIWIFENRPFFADFCRSRAQGVSKNVSIVIDLYHNKKNEGVVNLTPSPREPVMKPDVRVKRVKTLKITKKKLSDSQRHPLHIAVFLLKKFQFLSLLHMYICNIKSQFNNILDRLITIISTSFFPSQRLKKGRSV